MFWLQRLCADGQSLLVEGFGLSILALDIVNEAQVAIATSYKWMLSLEGLRPDFHCSMSSAQACTCGRQRSQVGHVTNSTCGKVELMARTTRSAHLRMNQLYMI